MKDTIIIHVKNEFDEALKKAADILRGGGTVAFPTETVYGLGANALNEEAINQIYVAKGRPSDNPLIVHISDIKELDFLVKEVTTVTKKLIDEFWPGAITLIFNSSNNVAKNVVPGLETVGIRMPSDPVARKLIELSGVPVAAPSANLSGKPSPTEGKHVIEDLMGRVDCIVISEQSDVGVESTILDTTQDPPMILRPGGITIESIEDLIGKIDLDPALDKKLEGHVKPKAPGMKYTHYSPEAEVIVISGKENNIIDKINELKSLYKDKSIGIMCSEEVKESFSEDLVISLGSKDNMEKIACNLFKSLRKFDEFRVDIVLAEGYDTVGMGKAIMNRLNKAAGFNIIKA